LLKQFPCLVELQAQITDK